MKVSAAGTGATRSKRTHAVAAIVLAAVTASPAHAADLFWTYVGGCGGADFSSTCWSDRFEGTAGTPGPASGDIAHLWQSGDVSLPVNFANAGSPTLSVMSGLDIASFFGQGYAALKLERNVLDTRSGFGGTSVGSHVGFGRIDQSGGSHKATNLYIGGYQGDADGTGLYNLSGGSLEVIGNALPLGTIILAGSRKGTGTFSQSGGSVSASGLYVGHNGKSDGGLGTYTLSGGTLTVDTVVSGASATFNFDGGSFDLTGKTASFSIFSIGSAAGSNAVFTQKAGQAITVKALELGAGVGGTGTYTLAGGTLNVKTMTNGAGTSVFNVDGGSLSFENAIDVDNFIIGITNVASVTVSGPRTLTAGLLRVGFLGNGSLFIQQGGQVSAGSMTVGSVFLFGGADGDVTVTGQGSKLNVGGSLTLGEKSANAVLTIQDHGQLEITGALAIAAKGVVHLESGALTAATVSGEVGSVIHHSGGTFTLTGADPLGSFAGTLDWSAGTLRMTGSGLALASDKPLGNSLTLSAGRNLVVSGSVVGGELSALAIDGGQLDVGGDIDVGTFHVGELADGSFDLTSARGLNAANLIVGVFAKGTMALKGGAQLTTTTASIGSFADGTVTMEGGATWFNPGTLTVGAHGNAHLTIEGGAVLTSGNAVVGGPATTSGLLSGPAGHGTVRASGAGSAWINVGDFALGGDADKAGGASTMTVEQGALVDVRGTLKVWNGSTVEVIGATLNASTLDNAGLLAGVGIVAGNVINAGRVAPGLSPGTLHIDGSFTQTTAGVLEIELLDASIIDQLLVESSAALDGTLALVCFADCHFAAGDDLLILQALGGITGSFANVTLSGFAAGTFDVVYDRDHGEIRLHVLKDVRAVPEPASYALILAGLGLLGLAARRGRRLATGR